VAPALVVLGGLAWTLWTLYAVWLSPEIYMGGVAAIELVDLPATLPSLGGLGAPLATLALGAVGAVGLAAILAAVLAVPRDLRPVSMLTRVDGALPAAVLAVAAALAAAAPVDAWRLLLAAFGFAASTGAPAALLACWRERASPRALGLGSAVGGVVFGVLALAGLGGGPRGAEASWAAWVVAWPALVGAPANALVAWLLSPPAVASGRDALPPDLAALHDEG
jgi:hypothetical protein